MNAFSIWFGTGLSHILDPSAYDHFLFVILLALSFPVSEWKKLLLLVTAFTVGHSLTLALSVLRRFSIPGPYIELGIALSILVTAGMHLVSYGRRNKTRPLLLYITTLLFGLLHGLGFSFLLRSMLDKQSAVILPLLYFNVGIEAGQLIIVAAILVISLFLGTLIHVQFKHFKITVVCIIFLIALKICAERSLLLFA
jgi:hypothetical protein